MHNTNDDNNNCYYYYVHSNYTSSVLSISLVFPNHFYEMYTDKKVNIL